MIMKTTMKKTAAILTALLMLVQIIPALADTYSSGVYAGGAMGYREELEIVASKGTYVLAGQELQLDVNAGYDHIEWTSSNEEIATIDKSSGMLTAVKAGTVEITATEGEYSAKTTITVVAPEPQPSAPAPGNNTDTGNQTPAQKEQMIIVINGESTRYVYDGNEHTLNTYVATSNSGSFEAGRIRVTGEIGVSAVNCGTYEFKLKESDFAYDDPNVNASFVVNNGWMKITPAKVTVTANAAEKEEGENDPELTATVEGLIGEDTIDYTLERFPGETAGQYVIEATGEKTQKNYRIDYADGIFTIKESFGPEYPLYNLVSINGTWYRLAKTTVRTKVDLTKNFGKKQNPDDYKAEPYDFTDLVITVNGKEYIYNCEKNRETIEAGARYYTASFTNYECIKNKIGGMNGSTPRWLVPENQRYNDPNGTDSFHRNFTIILQDNAEEQVLYNLLQVGSSNDYYRLRKTKAIGRSASEYKVGTALGNDIVQPIGGEYDFTNVTITIDGETYRYSDHKLEGEYGSYFTVEFVRITRQDRTNGNDDWFNDERGWLDGANYAEEGNDVVAYHRDYKATLHKGTKKSRSVTISSDWPEGKIAYPGAKITLTATTFGFGENVKYQWQRSAGNNVWEDIPGENGVTYTFILDDSTIQYIWRVVADD